MFQDKQGLGSGIRFNYQLHFGKAEGSNLVRVQQPIPWGISQSPASSSQPGENSLSTHFHLTPAWKSCTANTLLHRHLQERSRPPTDVAHISGSCFLHLVDADWANGRDGSTETLGPLEDGCGGRMMSPFKIFPSQGREMQLNVLQTQICSALRPESCHLSDSQRQEKLCPYCVLHMAFKGLGQCTSASSLPNERGRIYTRRSRNLGWEAGEDFGPGLLHWPRQTHFSLSALVMGQSLEVLSRHGFSCFQRFRRFSPLVFYSPPVD